MVSQNKNILIVDDDQMSIKLTEFVLSKDGYNVVTIASGEACIDYLKKNGNVDLVLLDIEMQGLNGIETLEKIRADKSIADTKVIFLTMYEFSKFEEESNRLGVLDFISKPVYGPEILERIKKVFTKVAANTKDTILVVDDDRMNLKFAEHMLSSVYNVVMALSYKEALDYLSKERPALALLDVHMPEMNGFEFIEKLRENPNYKETPIIVVSSESPEHYSDEIEKNKILKYIQKNVFKQDELTDLIQSVLNY